MPTQCSGERSGAGRVEGRQVAVGFDGGQISSDVGALSLRDVDCTLRLTERVAACFQDGRDPDLIEHTVRTLVMQRIVAIALGYEDLNDHDQLRRDPVLATLAGKLTAWRKGCDVATGHHEPRQPSCDARARQPTAAVRAALCAAPKRAPKLRSAPQNTALRSPKTCCDAGERPPSRPARAQPQHVRLFTAHEPGVESPVSPPSRRFSSKQSCVLREFPLRRGYGGENG